MSEPQPKSYVYCIGERTGTLVKIGVARNPEKRLKELQTGNGRKLYIVAKVPGGYAEEAAFRFAFGHLHEHGEWHFDEDKQISDFFIKRETMMKRQAEAGEIKDAALSVARTPRAAAPLTPKAKPPARSVVIADWVIPRTGPTVPHAVARDAVAAADGNAHKVGRWLRERGYDISDSQCRVMMKRDDVTYVGRKMTLSMAATVPDNQIVFDWRTSTSIAKASEEKTITLDELESLAPERAKLVRRVVEAYRANKTVSVNAIAYDLFGDYSDRSLTRAAMTVLDLGRVDMVKLPPTLARNDRIYFTDAGRELGRAENDKAWRKSFRAAGVADSVDLPDDEMDRVSVLLESPEVRGRLVSELTRH